MQNEAGDLEARIMNRLMLIIVLILFARLSEATFELEDPAELVKEKIEKNEMPFFKNWLGEKGVIVAPGTQLYTPNIENRQCESWQADESEPSPNDANGTQSTTATTYVGKLVSKVDCHGEYGSKQFSVIKTTDGRLIWVESDKALSTD